MKILVAVDGSAHALDAVRFVTEHAGWYRDKPVIDLVFVHAPLPHLPRMGMVVSNEQVQRYYKEEGDKALAAARRLLDAATRAVPAIPDALGRGDFAEPIAVAPTLQHSVLGWLAEIPSSIICPPRGGCRPPGEQIKNLNQKRRYFVQPGERGGGSIRRDITRVSSCTCCCTRSVQQHVQHEIRVISRLISPCKVMGLRFNDP